MSLQPAPKLEVNGESDDELNVEGIEYDESDVSSGESESEVANIAGGSSILPRARHRKNTEYKAAMVLATPRIVMSPVGQLYEDIEAGDIDLEPDYQRDVVWALSKQSAIIESLLRHYYIPPILFSSCAPGTGGQKFTCIDGKQRLSSIRNFMNNQIPVKDASGKNFWYMAKSGRPGLPPEVVKRFKREVVPTVIYENLHDDQEREMFQRVQMGMVLSPAEKVYARKGRWHDFIKEMTHKYMDESRPGQNLCHITKTTRAREWMGLAQIILLIYSNGNVAGGPPSDSKVGSFMDKHPEGPSDILKKEAEEAIDRYTTLANDPRWNTPLLPKDVRIGRLLSPAEFAYIGYMCWRYPNASYYDLARWVQILRTEVHEKFPSHVHFNVKVTAFLNEKLESFQEEGAAHTSSNRSTAAAIAARANGSTAAATTGRRRRAADEDEDFEPTRSRPRPRPSRDERTATRTMNDYQTNGVGQGASAVIGGVDSAGSQQSNNLDTQFTPGKLDIWESRGGPSGGTSATNGNSADQQGHIMKAEDSGTDSPHQVFYGNLQPTGTQETQFRQQQPQTTPHPWTQTTTSTLPTSAFMQGSIPTNSQSPLFFDAHDTSSNASVTPAESLIPRPRRLPPRNPFL